MTILTFIVGTVFGIAAVYAVAVIVACMVGLRFLSRECGTTYLETVRDIWAERPSTLWLAKTIVFLPVMILEDVLTDRPS